MPRNRFNYDVNDPAHVRARQRAIGRELRRRMEDIVREPVPEEWLDILRQIDAKNAGAQP